MIKTTQWKPDTCDCILHYEWSTETSEEGRIHTALPPIRRCELHSHIDDPQAHLEAVLEHNRANNG